MDPGLEGQRRTLPSHLPVAPVAPPWRGSRFHVKTPSLHKRKHVMSQQIFIKRPPTPSRSSEIQRTPALPKQVLGVPGREAPNESQDQLMLGQPPGMRSGEEREGRRSHTNKTQDVSQSTNQLVHRGTTACMDDKQETTKRHVRPVARGPA